MKALILALSAQRPPWGALMDAAMETWDSVDHPQTQTVYYCGKNPKGEIHNRAIYSHLSEHLHDLSARTMQALVHSLTLEWDFLARPNSSCYVHKVNLVKHLETLPATGVMRGLVTTGHNPDYMWGGGQYVFSRDVIEKLVANRHRFNDSTIQEDQALSKLALDCGFALDGKGMCASIDRDGSGPFRCICYGGGESFLFTDFADIKKAEGHFYFRCKQDHDRSIDVQIMHELFKHLP